MFSWIVEIVLSGLKTIFKARPNNGRTWVVCFVLVFCLSKVRYKYKYSSNQWSYFFLLMFVCILSLKSGHNSQKWPQDAILRHSWHQTAQLEFLSCCAISANPLVRMLSDFHFQGIDSGSGTVSYMFYRYSDFHLTRYQTTTNDRFSSSLLFTIAKVKKITTQSSPLMTIINDHS